MRRKKEYIYPLLYPKSFLFLLAIFVAYLLFNQASVDVYLLSLGTFSYYGSVFLSGFLYSFGFTAPFATGYFLTLHMAHPLFLALLGALGAFLADLSLFVFFRFSFQEEFRRFQKSSLYLWISGLFTHRVSSKVKLVLSYSFAALIILSPFPDEIGIAFLVGLPRIRPGLFALSSFFLNFLGIYLLLVLL